ncbi:MAG: hypothetical protein WA005_15310 [Candidatus Binataceae bacterium]
MRRRTGSYLSAAVLAAFCLAGLPGCAGMHQQREWGACTGVGAILGAAAGAASAIAIVNDVRVHPISRYDARGFYGLGGAVIGAGLGALAGHYLCDPLVVPPPPPPVAQAAPPPRPTRRSTSIATTDAIGSDEYNQALSERRASSAAKERARQKPQMT